MIFWIDAQLSPQLATWLVARFNVTAYAVRDLGLRDATDRAIFDAARAGGDACATRVRGLH
jgi:predicted nuclease of predicted toxin-antitoxin system